MKAIAYPVIILTVVLCFSLVACANPAVQTTSPGVTSQVASTTAINSSNPGALTPQPDFSFSGNPALNNTRSQIVVISDLHMGANGGIDGLNSNRKALVNFLTQIKNSPNIRELVIDGDMFSEWALPMDYVMPASESQLVEAMAANNPDVIGAFNDLIAEGNVKVTVIPGNHDILVTNTDLQKILPGIHQVRDDVRGTGTYVTGTDSEIAIEHGNRFTFFAAPDPVSNRDITNNNTSLLPPGYFCTRIATTSMMEGLKVSSNTFPALTSNPQDASQASYYLYAKGLEAFLSTAPVKESFNDKIIKTGIDGYSLDYAINDLVPHQDPSTGQFNVGLYQGIPDNWVKRQQMNGVAVEVSLKDAILKSNDAGFTDSQAQIQYFDRDSSSRIVIFGHTHVAAIQSCTNLEGQNCIYANSGSWLDNQGSNPTMTFVVVTLPETDSSVESVGVYRYSTGQTVTRLGDEKEIMIK